MIDTRNTATITSVPVTATGIVGSAARMISVWSARRQMRRSLSQLDTHLLRDIGLDETRARSEALKHFWLE